MWARVRVGHFGRYWKESVVAADAVVRALLPSVKDVDEGSNQLHLRRLWDVLVEGTRVMQPFSHGWSV